MKLERISVRHTGRQAWNTRPAKKENEAPRLKYPNEIPEKNKRNNTQQDTVDPDCDPFHSRKNIPEKSNQLCS